MSAELTDPFDSPFDYGEDAAIEALMRYAMEHGDERLQGIALAAMETDTLHARALALGEAEDIRDHARAVWESSNP